jgi:hypothetical protein
MSAQVQSAPVQTAPVKTVKRAVKKESSKAEEISTNVEKVVEQLQSSVEKKTRTKAAPKAAGTPVAAVEGTAPAPAEGTAKKTKSNSVYGDRIIHAMMSAFNLDEKKVREIVNNLVSSASEFKKTKKRKNKDFPRKGLSPYMLFAQDVRESIKKERPELKLPQLTSEIGRRWRELPQEQKAQYFTRAAADKAIQVAKQEEYRKSHPVAAPVAASSSETTTSPVEAAAPKKTRAKKAAAPSA